MNLQISSNKTKLASLMLAGLIIMALSVYKTEAAPLPPPTYYITSDYTVPRDIYARYVINANNITFNFNGYTISGNGLGTGIYINGKEGVDFTGNGRIKDHKVGFKVVGGDDIFTGFGSKFVEDCDTAVSIYNSDWVTLRNFDITECDYGVYMRNCYHCANLICDIDGGVGTGVAYGMQLQNNDYSEYTDIDIYYCSIDGIDADDEDYCSYEDVYTIDNGVHGLDFQNADYTDFYDHQGYNHSEWNGGNGLYVRHNNYYSEDGVYEYLQLNDNDDYGLRIRDGSDDNAFWNCYGEGNGIYDRRDQNGQGYNDYYYCDFETTIWY